jgi:hypothetical protein
MVGHELRGGWYPRTLQSIFVFFASTMMAPMRGGVTSKNQSWCGWLLRLRSFYTSAVTAGTDGGELFDRRAVPTVVCAGRRHSFFMQSMPPLFTCAMPAADVHDSQTLPACSGLNATSQEGAQIASFSRARRLPFGRDRAADASGGNRILPAAVRLVHHASKL